MHKKKEFDSMLSMYYSQAYFDVYICAVSRIVFEHNGLYVYVYVAQTVCKFETKMTMIHKTFLV